jgi:hypothetical protein
MNSQLLTDALAKRVMGWSASADRFLTGSRGWIPRWRFDPVTKVEDAFRLLDAAQPDRFEIRQEHPGVFSVAVRIGGRTGEARGATTAGAISLAVGRAVLGGEVDL